jgi:3-oxoacyl-[acyl-carrier protein] reductase
MPDETLGLQTTSDHEFSGRELQGRKPEGNTPFAQPLDRPLCGLTAVVTGASGGIGRQVAIAMADAGITSLIAHYASNLSGCTQTLQAVRERGCQATSLQADCGSPADCQRLVNAAFETLAWPDIWVHAAGVDVLTGEAAQWTFEAKLKRLIEVDLLGSIAVSRAALARWSDAAPPNAQGRGDARSRPAPSLILIGWDQAPHGMEGDAGQMFGPVKAGVEAFAKSLAQSAAPHVRVNTVSPGWIRTAWGEGTSDYWDRRAQGQALMSRWGTPADVAAAVLFLANPASEFITGQTIEVNGGFSRKWRHD